MGTRTPSKSKSVPPTPAPVERVSGSLKPPIAAALVFVASGAVLVLEILSVRLLAPYVGLTLETTTSIIGAVLFGIAAGAALGGWIADRVNPYWLLVGLLVGGGLLVLLDGSDHEVAGTVSKRRWEHLRCRRYLRRPGTGGSGAERSHAHCRTAAAA